MNINEISRGGFIVTPPPAFANKPNPKDFERFKNYGPKAGNVSKGPPRMKGVTLIPPEPKVKSFQPPKTIVRLDEIFSSPDVASNGDLKQKILSVGMKTVATGIASYFEDPSEKKKKKKSSRIPARDFGKVLAVGTSRIINMNLGTEALMPKSSVATPNKVCVYRSDLVLESVWKKAPAYLNKSIGLNEQLIQIFPTELPEQNMRRFSVATGLFFYDYPDDLGVKTFWDSPSRAARSGEYLGNSRKRYSPVQTYSKFTFTNLNSFLPCTMKFSLVQLKDRNSSGAMYPSTLMGEVLGSMEPYDKIDLISRNESSVVDNTHFVWGQTPRSLVHANGLATAKTTGNFKKAPLFDQNFRLLKSQTVTDVNPGDSVTVNFNNFQNICYSETGDFDDFGTIGNTVSQYSERAVFLMVETSGRKDTVCYTQSASGDPVTYTEPIYDLRTGPATISYSHSMYATNYSVPMTLGASAGTFQTYVKTYNNFDQSYGISEVGYTPATDIVSNATEIAAGDSKWIVPLMSNVEQTSARVQAKNKSDPR